MKAKTKNLDKKAYRNLVISATLWGLSPFFYKQGLLFVSILIFLGLRFAIGALCIFITERKKFVRLTLKIITIITAFALLDALLVNIVYSFAIQRTTILHASIIQLSVPFLVYFFAAIILREKPHKIVLFGSTIAVIGLAVIVFANSSVSTPSTGLQNIGDIVMFGCVCLSALSIVLGRKVLSKVKKLPSEQLGFMEYAISAVPFFVIIALHGSWHSLVTIPPIAWVWILAAAIISGSLPITFYYRSVKRLPAERLADMSFISPAVSGIVGILFLSEQLTPAFIMGTSLVLVGLMVSHNKIHPVMTAHKVGSDIKALNAVFRFPQRAYQYISVENLFYKNTIDKK